MSERVDPQLALLPSLLDRLLPPEAARVPLGPEGDQRLAELREAVRLDLEALFATRRRCLPCPDRYAEAKDRSLAAYGMPDFTRLSLESPEELEALRATVERQLRAFEPRLVEITVDPVQPGSDAADRRLRLRIRARLRVTREEVVFLSRYDAGDAALQLE